MKFSPVRFFIIYLLSTALIPGVSAQGLFSGFLDSIATIFGGTTDGGGIIGAFVAVVQTTFDTIVAAAVTVGEVVGRAVGIPTADNEGVFCTPALDGITGTLAAQFGDAVDIEDYDCSCQFVGNLPLPRIQVECNVPEPVCFQDNTDNAEYCGFINLELDVTIGDVDIGSFTFTLVNFGVFACWDFEDSGDGGDYKTMCIATTTNQDFDEFGQCQVTADDDACSCEPCNEGEGIIADCSTINLNSDPDGEALFLPATPCVGPNNIDTFAILNGNIDPDFHLFMLPLVRRAMQEQSN